MRAVVAAVWVVRWPSTQSFRCDWFCLATNQIAQTGLSSLPPVIYYSEQLFSVFTQPIMVPAKTRAFIQLLAEPREQVFRFKIGKGIQLA